MKKLTEMLSEIKRVEDPNEIIKKTLIDFKELLKDNAKVENFEIVIRNQLKEINEVLKDPSIIKCIPSGFYELDRLTNGFEGGGTYNHRSKACNGENCICIKYCIQCSNNRQKGSVFLLRND